MGYKTSQNGIDLIKSFEGCALKAYRCPAGILTIGYGHTGGVKEGQIIIQTQAESMLKADLGRYENSVNKCVTTVINQNQFDALVSFAYNCGCGALNSSTLLKYLNQGNYESSANAFNEWVHGGGKVLPGLVRRRAAEKKLFLTPVKFEVKEDSVLYEAIREIIRNGVIIDINCWKRLELIKLENVEILVCRLAKIKVEGSVTDAQYKEAIDKLVLKQAISQRVIWDERRYTANNVRSLLLKYAKSLG